MGDSVLEVFVARGFEAEGGVVVHEVTLSLELGLDGTEPVKGPFDQATRQLLTATVGASGDAPDAHRLVRPVVDAEPSRRM